MKGLPALAVVIGVSLLLASCGKSAGPPDAISAKTTPRRPTTTTTTAPPLPITPITWTACNGDLQCGTLIVPLDYAHPQGATIGIAVERHLARDVAGRIGSLVINPGGPGVSGIDDFVNELDTLTPQLLDDAGSESPGSAVGCAGRAAVWARQVVPASKARVTEARGP